MNRLKVCVDRETQLARASIGIRTVTMTNAAIKHSERSETRTSVQQLHVVWAAVGRCEICVLRVPSITFDQSSKPSFTINYNKNIVYLITVIRWCRVCVSIKSSKSQLFSHLVLTTHIGT